MLIGEATLTSPAFSPRLTSLVGDLQRAGCTVWLEGLRLRFDCLDAKTDASTFKALLSRYEDVVTWSPEPRTEFFFVSPVLPRPHTPLGWSKLFKAIPATKRPYGLKR